MKVVQVGLEGGVVPGGGAAYLDVVPAVEAAACGHGEEALGMRALARALEEPARVIATNADAYGPLVVNACRERGPGYAYEGGAGLRARHGGGGNRRSNAGGEGGVGAGGERRGDVDFGGGAGAAAYAGGEL